MAGAMRKMAVYLGLVEDDDRGRDDYEDDDYDEPTTTRRRSAPRTEYRSVTVTEPSTSVRTFRDERSARPERAADPMPERASSTVRPMPAPTPPPPPTIDLYRITTIHPHTYNDARRIGEEFREGVPVIMNLTEMEDGDAKRIVDFAAGLVFGLHGTIERITNKVFLLSPVNVDVGAEARAQLAQNGFFNQS